MVRNSQTETCRKVVILGSIKSDKEMSITFHFGKSSRILRNFESYFSEKP